MAKMTGPDSSCQPLSDLLYEAVKGLGSVHPETALLPYLIVAFKI